MCLITLPTHISHVPSAAPASPHVAPTPAISIVVIWGGGVDIRPLFVLLLVAEVGRRSFSLLCLSYCHLEGGEELECALNASALVDVLLVLLQKRVQEHL